MKAIWLNNTKKIRYFWSKYFATKVSPIYKLNSYLPRQNPKYNWLRRRDSEPL